MSVALPEPFARAVHSRTQEIAAGGDKLPVFLFEVAQRMTVR